MKGGAHAPEWNTKYYKDVKEIARVARGPAARLRSIRKDANFVESVVDLCPFGWAVAANLRCGLWYVKTHLLTDCCYFKSTDGHFGEWNVSLSRLNIGVLDLLSEHGALLIVDATRRGKRFPDALSKSIPLWVAVMNEYLGLGESDVTVPEPISGTEKAQMTERVKPLVTKLAPVLDTLITKDLRNKLFERGYLRPFFVSGTDSLAAVQDVIDEAKELFRECMPLILVSASSMADSDGIDGYIPGAADDEESWARGLRSADFWQSEIQEQLDLVDNRTGDEHIINVIDKIVAERSHHVEDKDEGMGNVTESLNLRQEDGSLKVEIEIEDIEESEAPSCEVFVRASTSDSDPPPNTLQLVHTAANNEKQARIAFEKWLYTALDSWISEQIKAARQGHSADMPFEYRVIVTDTMDCPVTRRALMAALLCIAERELGYDRAAVSKATIQARLAHVNTLRPFCKVPRVYAKALTRHFLGLKHTY
eukprot:Clim_evm201s157 gene=Clim_evmTU201s157